MARRQILAGQLFQGRGIKRIQAIVDKDVGQLTISEAIKLVEAGVRLERLGRGEPLDLPQTLIHHDIGAAGAEALIIDILRRHPSRRARRHGSQRAPRLP